jgi:hypothetical protein
MDREQVDAKGREWEIAGKIAKVAARRSRNRETEAEKWRQKYLNAESAKARGAAQRREPQSKRT